MREDIYVCRILADVIVFLNNNTADIMSDMNNKLPDFLACAKPNPKSGRASWDKNIAPSYAGVMLWFTFWLGLTQCCSAGAGSVFSHGYMLPILALALAALTCFVFYYVVLGEVGRKTGLPLYIVGTSTFGAKGGFLLPGLLMGLLQFGWVAVNIYFSTKAIMGFFPEPSPVLEKGVMIGWGVVAAILGLGGIAKVGKVVGKFHWIPIITLLVMACLSVPHIGKFDHQAMVELNKVINPAVGAPLAGSAIVFAIAAYVIGFFATAGAAGVDFGANARDKRDVCMGGIVGIFGSMVFAGGLAILIVAGAYGKYSTPETIEVLRSTAFNPTGFIDNAMDLVKILLGENLGRWVLLLLAIAAFPSACFSSLIAANSIKTVLPKIPPFISVGVGAAIAILLALFGYAANLGGVFGVIGASFGPICGAMAVDYFTSGKRWSGPRAGFNPPGWMAWGLGFIVGILPNFGCPLPAAPFWAMLVGAVVYYLGAKFGLENKVIPYGPTDSQIKDE